jgi:hypothetical protein
MPISIFYQGPGSVGIDLPKQATVTIIVKSDLVRQIIDLASI